ncbi:MAG: right-handed parallel beta-helix repeat-containing protein, partial [Bacteroidota bacterium]
MKLTILNVTKAIKVRWITASAMLCIAVLASAQLNGNYSIGSTGDYPTFNDAVVALISDGVNGDVTFEVQPGNYQERIVMNLSSVTFASGNESISFIGQGASPEDVLLIFQSNSFADDYTLQINGGQNVSFENMKFQNVGLVNANVVGVGLDQSVAGITFNNCHFQGASSFIDGTFPTSVYFESGTSDITVTNTIHRGSNYGITCWSGTSDILIRNNQMFEQNVQAMSLSVSNALIENNYIEKRTDAANQYNYGIEVWQGNDFIVRSNEFVLDHAKIAGLALNDDFTVTTSYNEVVGNTFFTNDLNNGIRVSGSNNSLIANNFTEFNNAKFGVFLSDADNTYLVQNTFKMNSEGDLLVVVSGNSIQSFNNIMINYGEGTVYASLTDFNSDYNFVFTAGEEFSSDDDTFELHKEEAGQDVNSTSFLLEFIDPTSPEVCHYAVSGTGLNLTSLTGGVSLVGLDYFGNARNESAPDIGAYEFGLPTTTIFPSDTLAICEGDLIDLGADNPFLNYLWLNDSSTLATIPVDTANTYYLQVEDNIGCVLLDSIYIDVQSVAIDLGEDQFICLGNTITLEAEPGLASYTWSNGETTSSIEVTDPGTYAVLIENELGCVAQDTIVISLSEDTFNPNFLISNVGCIADTIQFVEVSNLAPDSVFWDFGDGNSSKEMNPSHIYGVEGDFMVTMIATIGQCALLAQKSIS